MTLSIVADATTLIGAYHCLDGTAACDSQADHGRICAGHIDGDHVDFRVIMGQGSCLYEGVFRARIAEGKYICMLSNGLEQGAFRIKRLA